MFDVNFMLPSSEASKTERLDQCQGKPRSAMRKGGISFKNFQLIATAKKGRFLSYLEMSLQKAS